MYSCPTVLGLPKRKPKPVVYGTTSSAKRSHHGWPDGSPQASVIWIGLDGDDIVSGHMGWYTKLKNIDRDPRVVLSFDAPREPGVFLNPYAVIQAEAQVEKGVEAWDLLDRLAKVYMGPDANFPAPRGPGFLLRYKTKKIGGVGPWVKKI